MRIKFDYIVYLYQVDTGYRVEIPDLADFKAEIKDLETAREWVVDVVNKWVVDCLNRGKELPEPTKMDSRILEGHQNGMTIIVYVDISDHKKMEGLEYVDKECEVPAWLNDEAERAGLDLSDILIKALIDKLD